MVTFGTQARLSCCWAGRGAEGGRKVLLCCGKQPCGLAIPALQSASPAASDGGAAACAAPGPYHRGAASVHAPRRPKLPARPSHGPAVRAAPGGAGERGRGGSAPGGAARGADGGPHGACRCGALTGFQPTPLSVSGLASISLTCSVKPAVDAQSKPAVDAQRKHADGKPFACCMQPRHHLPRPPAPPRCPTRCWPGGCSTRTAGSWPRTARGGGRLWPRCSAWRPTSTAPPRSSRCWIGVYTRRVCVPFMLCEAVHRHVAAGGQAALPACLPVCLYAACWSGRHRLRRMGTVAG